MSSELVSIVKAAAACRASGEEYMLATVVGVRGSAYRRPGARMLVTTTSWLAGSISGGCLEGDVVARAWWRTRDVSAVLVTYDASSDDDVRGGFGLGCDGAVDVLLERDAAPVVAFVERCLAAERRGALVTVFRSARDDVPVGARVAVTSGAVENHRLDDSAARTALIEAARALLANELGGRARVVRAQGVEALVEPVAPPPHLFVWGAGHDVVPLIALAKTVGWSVTACDRQGRFSARERTAAADRRLVASPMELARAVDACARAAAVVMSHDYEHDRAALRALLGSRADYIGMLGPRRRTERMLAEIAPERGGLVDADLARVHAPAGVDLGAETPAEIALSIVSEVQATFARASCAPLRARPGPIHGDARVGCAVLAAGASRRLGRPKQLVRHRGKPLVRLAAEAACASSCHEVAVVVGAHGPAVRGVVSDLALDVVENAVWSEGLAASVRAAAAWAAARRLDALVLVACDQPALGPVHLDDLVAAHARGADAVASEYGGVLGVPALFDARWFEALGALRGDRGAGSLLRELRSAVVPWPEGARDVDVEADLALLES